MMEELAEPVPRKQSASNAFNDPSQSVLKIYFTTNIINKKVLVYFSIFKILEKIRVKVKYIYTKYKFVDG